MRPVFLVLLAAGCAAGTRLPSPAQPHIEARRFLELQNQSFRLVTDLDDAQARRRLAQLERTWWALLAAYDVLLPGQAMPPIVNQVVHLRDCRYFDALLEPALRGRLLAYMIPSGGLSGEPLMVTCERAGDITPEAITHELVHVIQAHYFTVLPRWLEEGIASFLGSLKIDAASIELGLQPRNGISGWGEPWRLNSLLRLREMTARDFFDERASDAYFASWAAVHLLVTTSRSRFVQLLAAHAAGLTPAEAWARAFGDLAEDSLQRAYVDSVERATLRTLSVSHQPRPPSRAGVRELGAGEAHGVWLQLMFHARDSLGEAVLWQQLAFAAAADRDWADLPLWRALLGLASARTDLDDPRRALVAAAFANPRSNTARLLLVQLEMGSLTPFDDLGVGPVTPPGLAALEGEVRILAATAARAGELATVARYYAFSRRPQEGIDFAVRAVRQFPSCVACHDVLGLLYFQLGRRAEAIAAAERAVARGRQLRENGERLDPRLELRLAYYRSTPP
jgi:tetratricopeptide (TPR) repeat protein